MNELARKPEVKGASRNLVRLGRYRALVLIVRSDSVPTFQMDHCGPGMVLLVQSVPAQS